MSEKRLTDRQIKDIKGRKWSESLFDALQTFEAEDIQSQKGISHDDQIWILEQCIKAQWRQNKEEVFQTAPKRLEGLRDSLDLGSGNKISGTLNNYQIVAMKDSFLMCLFKKNTFTGKIEVGRTYWNDRIHEFGAKDLYEVRVYMERFYGLTSKAKIEDTIVSSAEDFKFNPIEDYLNNLEWDGEKRIENFFPYFLGAEKSDLTTHLTLMLFHGLICRGYNPGTKFDVCIVLQDSKQGTGKSSLVRFLAIKDEWYLSLKSIEDEKSTSERARGKWVVELEEMLSIKRARDVEQVKGFLSTIADDVRLPYDKFTTRIPRGFCCVGTSNRPDCLPPDPSGNRRFLPIVCNHNKAKQHPLDDEGFTRNFVDQCYAEALQIGREKGWTLTPAKEYLKRLEELQSDSMPDDPWVGMIEEWLYTQDGPVCSAMVWDKVIATDMKRLATKQDLMHIADVLNHVQGWARSPKKKRLGDPYGIQRVWERVASSGDDVASFREVATSEVPFEAP